MVSEFFSLLLRCLVLKWVAWDLPFVLVRSGVVDTEGFWRPHVVLVVEALAEWFLIVS